MPNTVFISTSFDSGWIIEKIAAQLQETLEQIGVATAIGYEKDYRDEPIVFQTKFLYAKPYPRALVNSIFVTHIDDRLKEIEVAGLRNMANSFVCMSPEDASFLIGLGFAPQQVVGMDLPFFDQDLEPLKLCIFSKRYADGRKNENWILEWASKNTRSQSGIYFSFIGSGWLPIAEKLENQGWSVEVISPNRTLSAEYDIQLRSLRSADAYFYMGFDGGALGSYDAFKAGIPLYVSKTSYHHGIPGVQGMFGDEQQFHATLTRFAEEWHTRKNFAASRSMTEYTKQLLQHWATVSVLKGSTTKLYPDQLYSNSLKLRASRISNEQILPAYRDHYQPLSLFRVLGSTKRILKRFF